MSWVKREMPVIPGYESLGDNVGAKSWLNFRLDALLDDAPPLAEYAEMLGYRQAVCDFVITEILYPLQRGVPSDLHKNNWFSGACCHSLTEDYWQRASETLTTLLLNKDKGIGDCEDTAVLAGNLFRVKKWNYWVVIGYVYQGDELLGGHGWSLLQTENKKWILYESTLEVPPAYPTGYPVGHPDATEWHIEGLTYKGIARFKKGEYYESSDMPEGMGMSFGSNGSYIRRGIKEKESKKKHLAISRAWGIKTKPLAQANLLTKVRWK